LASHCRGGREALWVRPRHAAGTIDECGVCARRRTNSRGGGGLDGHHMTDITGEHDPKPVGFAVSEASVRASLAFVKPRVMPLVVFTALVGLMVTPGHLHPVLGFAALLCITVGAGAAGTLNMWYDADIDAVMRRTSQRPIPAGRVLPQEALAFGVTLA